MKKVIELEGNANDLLSVDEKNHVRMTRFIVNSENNPETEEVIDVTIMSTDPSGKHLFFDTELRHKKVKITIETDA